MGPHVDNFAVFLVQLPGAPKKWELEYNNKNANWQISKMEEYSRLSPNPSVRILEDYGFGDAYNYKTGGLVQKRKKKK